MRSEAEGSGSKVFPTIEQVTTNIGGPVRLTWVIVADRGKLPDAPKRFVVLRRPVLKIRGRARVRGCKGKGRRIGRVAGEGGAKGGAGGGGAVGDGDEVAKGRGAGGVGAVGYGEVVEVGAGGDVGESVQNAARLDAMVEPLAVLYTPE